MNKTELINKLKQLSGLTTDEKAALINLVNTKKKYGLVWEDKPEDVEEQLRENLPVFVEVPEKRIVYNPDAKDKKDTNDGYKTTQLNFNEFNNPSHPANPLHPSADNIAAPNHILIEGDNLHALTALTFTHEGKIDVIYIDPPYNTGKATEFKYNDKYVDEEDGFRHSKWLSFMNKRLTLAHRLLSDTGIIIINIDDNEVSQLNLLCNEIFNHSQNPKNSNQLGLLVWDLGTGTSAGHFTRTNEFILVFAKDKKNIPNFSGGEGIIDDRAQKKIGIKNPVSEFEFKAGTKFEAPDGFELTGKWGGTEETTLVSGRMRCHNGKLLENVTLSAGWTQKNQMKSFFEGLETIDSKGQKVIEFYFKENGKIYCRKERSILNPPSVLREIATTKQGTSLLKNIFNGDEPIQFVKPIQLIQYFLELLPKNIQVLDFFAGSGTTLHATMQLNADDEGTRKCILVTNNENNICEEVTYVRNKRVIQGYNNLKGEKVDGLFNNNLRYYKSSFVPREKSLKNKRQLTQLATDLLCIKEDCYTLWEQDFKDLKDGQDATAKEIKAAFKKEMRLFKENSCQLLIVYNDAVIAEAVEVLKYIIHNKAANEKTVVTKVYVFSNGQYPYTEDFEEILPHITLCALPDAIYKAYQNVLPKKKGLNQDAKDNKDIKDEMIDGDLFSLNNN